MLEASYSVSLMRLMHSFRVISILKYMDGGGLLLQPIGFVVLPSRPSRGSRPLVSILMPKWRAVEIMVAGPPCSIEEVLYYPECADLDSVQQRQA